MKHKGVVVSDKGVEHVVHHAGGGAVGRRSLFRAADNVEAEWDKRYADNGVFVGRTAQESIEDNAFVAGDSAAAAERGNTGVEVCVSAWIGCHDARGL